jgi:hypothetical protein
VLCAHDHQESVLNGVRYLHSRYLQMRGQMHRWSITEPRSCYIEPLGAVHCGSAISCCIQLCLLHVDFVLSKHYTIGIPACPTLAEVFPFTGCLLILPITVERTWMPQPGYTSSDLVVASENANYSFSSRLSSLSVPLRSFRLLDRYPYKCLR